MQEQVKYSMYFFVLRQLNGLNKGIQCGHAALDFMAEYGHIKAYVDFVKYHKTWIILEGGGSQDMIDRCDELADFGIDYTFFREPDLADMITAVAFIMPNIQDGGDMWGGQDYTIAQWLKGFRLASN